MFKINMINRKSKGTNAERNLIKLFHDHGWSALRSAGSGSSKYPSPDVLAGNGFRRIALECKTTKDNKKYLKNDEIEQLKCLLEDKDIGCEISISIVDIMNKFNSMDKHKKNENMTKLDIMLDIFNERYNKVPKNLNTLAFLADDDKIMLYDHIIPHIDKFDFGLILEYIYDG